VSRPDRTTPPSPTSPVLPPYLQQTSDGVLLSVKAQPRASRNEVAGMQGQELRVRVTAPPVDSSANDALLRFLAERLECPLNRLRLVRGRASRHKQFHIAGIPPSEIARRLESPV